jgi:hypothetical protein
VAILNETLAAPNYRANGLKKPFARLPVKSRPVRLWEEAVAKFYWFSLAEKTFHDALARSNEAQIA